MAPIDTDAYVIEPEKKSKHYKGWFIALGVLMVLFGIICLAWPGASLLTVAILVGIGFLMTGITAMATYFDLNRLIPVGGGWTLMGGVLDILLGVLFLVQPSVGALTISLLGGIALIVFGIMDGVASWRLREVTGTGACVLGIIAAVLTVILGILMLAMPELFIIYLGCVAIVRGIEVIVMAFQVSSRIKDIKARIGA